MFSAFGLLASSRPIGFLAFIMLSYVHDFHAGSFADVHKHAVLSIVHAYLNRKPKPMALVDLYAGSGRYQLNTYAAQKTGESHRGIERVWPPESWPSELADYARCVRAENADQLKAYPGSPALLKSLARPIDRLIFNELHPKAQEKLVALYDRDRQVKLYSRDAHEALVALVPPTEKRGLILLDPSYEQKEEYNQLMEGVLKAFKRWRTGIFIVWYPLLPSNAHRAMVDGIVRGVDCETFVSEIRVPTDGTGMHGSGMLVLNPTWNLASTMKTLTPWLAQLGGEAGQAVMNNRLNAAPATKGSD